MANGAVNPASNAKGMGTASSSVGKNVRGRLPRRWLTKWAANAMAIDSATIAPSPTPKNAAPRHSNPPSQRAAAINPPAYAPPTAPMGPKNMAAIYSLENFVAWA